MGTKNNPGEYDCYAKLDPDEPYFTVRAKDPMGASTVRAWALNRAHMIKMGTAPQSDHPKVEEAYRCASDMEIWRAKNLKDDERTPFDPPAAPETAKVRQVGPKTAEVPPEQRPVARPFKEP